MVTFTKGEVVQSLNIDASCLLSSYRGCFPFRDFFPFLAVATDLLLALVSMIESVLGLPDLLLDLAFFSEVIMELTNCHDMVLLLYHFFFDFLVMDNLQVNFVSRVG